MYNAASSSCLPPHSNSSVVHSVALSQPTAPLVLLLAVGGVVFIHAVQSGPFMFPWLYSTAWLWFMAQAVRFRCTDSEWEASTRAARVAWRASSVMASDAALLPGQSELICIRGGLDGIVPSSHQTHEGNHTNSWTFSTFVQYVSAGMTTKQMKPWHHEECSPLDVAMNELDRPAANFPHTITPSVLLRNCGSDWTTNNKFTEVYMILMTSACILH